MSILIHELLVSNQASILEALEVINRGGLGAAFVVEPNQKFRAIVTHENIRQQLLNGTRVTDSVMKVITSQQIALPATASQETIQAHLNEYVRIVPLLNEMGQPVDYAIRQESHFIPVMEPLLSGNELSYVIECILTNWISSQGQFVKRFEATFAEYIGVEQAIAASNGTAALHLALLALGIGPGDEVIVPDLTFAASVNAVLYVGATPVLVDVTRDTWTIDPELAAQAITPRTKAIMPVHLYGQAADMEAILALAKTHNLLVIEDVAEALGATYQGQQLGSFGDAAAFSFFGNKLITTGEGGMVVFRDPEVTARARRLRDHGMDPQKRYWHTEVGYNYRLTNLQAAIGLAQLERIETFIQLRLELATRYIETLSQIAAITLPIQRPDSRNVYWLISFLFDHPQVSREDLMQNLKEHGIDTRPLFYPIHIMPPYQPFAGHGHFPNTDYLAKHGMSLPSAVTLTVAEVDHICETITRVALK